MQEPDNQTPNQGVPQVTGGQTPAPGYVPGQTPAPPGYVPGQTPAPGNALDQTTDPGQEPAQVEIIQRFRPSDDFTHVYQTGNFGKHFGKVNTTRGMIYAIVHGVLSLLMLAVTIASTVKMKHYLYGPIKKPLLAITWLCVVFDCLCVVAAVYFMRKLSTLKNPMSALLLMRTFAFFSRFMNLLFLVVGFLPTLTSKRELRGFKEIDSLKSIYATIATFMFLKIFTSTAFLFHWWHFCPCWQSACSCFAPFCVFDQGEELAPGVPNSDTAEIVMACGGVDESTYA